MRKFRNIFTKAFAIIIPLFALILLVLDCQDQKTNEMPISEEASEVITEKEEATDIIDKKVSLLSFYDTSSGLSGYAQKISNIDNEYYVYENSIGWSVQDYQEDCYLEFSTLNDAVNFIFSNTSYGLPLYDVIVIHFLPYENAATNGGIDYGDESIDLNIDYSLIREKSVYFYNDYNYEASRDDDLDTYLFDINITNTSSLTAGSTKTNLYFDFDFLGG